MGSHQSLLNDGSAGKPDLPARIHEAELALIRRDLRVRAAVQRLKDRTQDLTSATRWLSGAGTIGSLLLGLMSGRKAADAEHRRAPAGTSLLQFLPLLWPLLPVALRRRVKPGAIELVVQLVLPWLRRRRRPRSEPPAPHTPAPPRSEGR